MEIEQQRLRHDSDKGPLLEVHLYVTSAQSPADLKALNVYLSLDLIGRQNEANCQAIDGLRQRTKHGRPDWEQVSHRQARCFFLVSNLLKIRKKRRMRQKKK